jgi:hypothetical protein
MKRNLVKIFSTTRIRQSSFDLIWPAIHQVPIQEIVGKISKSRKKNKHSFSKKYEKLISRHVTNHGLDPTAFFIP